MNRIKVHNRKIAAFCTLGTFTCLILSLLEPPMGWVLVLCVCSFVITGYKAQKNSPPLKNSVLNLLAILCISIIIWLASDYGLLKSMINLLVVSCCLKILNLHHTGDYQMVASIQLFLIGCGLIFHQSLGYSIFYCCLIVMLFCALHAIKVRETNYKNYSKQTLLLVLQAVPIALVLFFVTPKLNPLWKMPVAKGSQTGLSEKMTPGDIANLAKSDELVFRAEFAGDLPKPQERYWRAIVLDEFDGKTWSISERAKNFPLPSEVQFQGKSLDYSVIAEPTSTNWLYSLDIPILIQGLSTQRIISTQQFQLQSRTPLHSKGLYVVKSFIEQPLNIYNGFENTSFYLQTPTTGNPKTVEYVLNNISPSMSTRQKIDQLNALFADDDFKYSLTPPLMQTNPIDQFLFDKKTGFCSHYASAMAYMLRIANVPARIVTGYQGGELQSNNVISVHQFDAHAWVEAWDKDLGWIRTDPTAIVAPNRVLAGLLSSLENRAEFRNESPFSLSLLQDYALLNNLRLLLAEIDHTWSQSILRYNQESQKSLLKKIFGDMSPRSFSYAIIGSFVVIGIFIALLFIPRQRENKKEEQKWLETVFSLLEKQGHRKENSETLQQFSQRISPSLNSTASKSLRYITKVYYQWHYSQKTHSEPFAAVKDKMKKQLSTLKAAIKK
ncbi:DUF3488 domain-containing transglutaminase family protein [Glaciecola sp. MH2013]|uniref:transglutaminase family protein n=1 Tax=Glaciecola sp. MH2013 TaxID=2785524 RepID=UPI0018A11CC1|nr:DUF3488 and transglutaminase-like domain-containing protein [Glaciecola sp. MH2013]MBF7072992.1 DUF3488 domain-containing transglutaminase family protein [Glaciecola sp. MH2013]